MIRIYDIPDNTFSSDDDADESSSEDEEDDDNGKNVAIRHRPLCKYNSAVRTSKIELKSPYIVHQCYNHTE